jgi:hypothetical protein
LDPKCPKCQNNDVDFFIGYFTCFLCGWIWKEVVEKVEIDKQFKGCEVCEVREADKPWRSWCA